MSTSFEERSVWIQLISQLAGMGAYAAVAGPKLAESFRAVEEEARAQALTALTTASSHSTALEGAQVATTSFFPVLFAVTLIIVINVVGHAVAAIASRPEGRDERDRVIGWRAAHGSEWVLGLGTVVGITALMLKL